MSSANPDAAPSQPPSGQSLAEVALVFLRLGTTAFGGPAAHVAMMEQEFVRRRKWLSHQQFLDMLGAVNLIPGPNSTEMAIYIGYLRAGWPGLLLGGVCFILPAMLMVAGLAWGYAVYGNFPQVAGVLRGVKPVVIAIIVQALVGLGPKAVKTPWLGLIAVAALAASLAGLDPLSVVLMCGAIQSLARSRQAKQANSRWSLAMLLLAVCGILMLIHVPHFFTATFFLRRQRRREAIRRPRPSTPVPGRSFFTSSRSAPCSTAAAMCCWPSCRATWSPAG